MAGTRRIGPDSHGWATGRPAPCQSEDDVAPPPARQCSSLALSLAVVPCAQADGPPAGRERHGVHLPRARGAALRHAPGPHPRALRRRPGRQRRAPALTSTRVAGVPDWVVSAGELAEDAWARETAARLPGAAAPTTPTAPSAGETARYDLYVCDLAAPGLGELAATVADPPGSGFSYVVSTTTTPPREVAPLTSSGLEQLRVSIAHELFHAIQIGESRGRLPEWLAEATAVWMEGRVAPPGRRPRDLPGGARRRRHRAAVLAQRRPPRVRRLVADRGARARATRVRAPPARRSPPARGDDDPDGLAAAGARASAAARALEAAFVRFARTAVDDPLVGPALRARRTRAPRRRRAARAARARAAAQLPPLARADAATRRDRAAQRRTRARRRRAPRAGRSASLPRGSAAARGRAGGAARAGRRGRGRRAGRAAHTHRMTLRYG